MKLNNQEYEIIFEALKTQFAETQDKKVEKLLLKTAIYLNKKDEAEDFIIEYSLSE